MKFSNILFLILFISISTSLASQKSMNTFKKFADKYGQHLVDGNADAIGNMFSSKAKMTGPEGEAVHGSEGVKKFYGAQLQQMNYKKVKILTDDVVDLPGGYIVGTGTYTATVEVQGQVQELKGYFQNLAKMEKGDLKIIRHMAMSPAIR